MTDEEKRKIVEAHLAEELDRMDDDDYDGDDESTVEELMDDSEMLQSISDKLKDTKQPKRVKYGDLTVEFEPSGK